MASSLTTDKQEERESEGFEVENGNMLNSSTGHYLILDFIGEGRFGKVAKSVNLITAQDVALKIFKTEENMDMKREINMLEVLSVLDPVKTSVVQYFEKFQHKGHICLAFEMLDRNLYQLLIDRQYKPLSLSEIRLIAHQLLTALDALKGLGIIHCDLKPDNIMLVNHEDQPFRVKVIDFGVSYLTSEVARGMTMQALGYRAPEVILGLPISRAIDMWGLGCVLSFLYITDHLFGVCCEYQMVRSIVEVLGQPTDELLSDGDFTRTFFKENRHLDHPKWLLKTPAEYQQETGKVPALTWNVCSLDKLVTIYPKTQESIEMADCRGFVSLLEDLLQMDPKQRITPAEAFAHPFLCMIHLVEEMETSLYVDPSMMDCCQMDDSEDDNVTSPNGKYFVAPFSRDITRLPDGAAAAGVEGGSVGAIQICKTNDSWEQTPDDEAEEKPKVEVLPAIHSPDSASSISYEGRTSLPDGAAAAGAEVDSAEEEPAVGQEVASRDPAEETSAPDRSPDEGDKVKNCLKSIRNFLSRAMRTVFKL
ncbi:putative homeodomain-interacting protein kinase 2-like [Scophthalmus maximus]|uniref:Putative homeodomain-interacting protein kinase 2-like n=1 Tax=Scophthalmus maximus TaxID=52904 RepID=A0A2U9CLT9_SCOMX|nr:homeodomain-interacting protein kinase 2-like isoform X1 [Scophthalmus maximus]AWP16799.1 putative homeodomain-interacting protein kinase 2-like [Scophthalmus maximus]